LKVQPAKAFGIEESEAKLLLTRKQSSPEFVTTPLTQPSSGFGFAP
jgi:hypothetical protein